MSKSSSDGWIAGAVVLCSVVLLLALSFGLGGKVASKGAHLVNVRFRDVTGIKVSSHVKFAGAPAGTVSGIRVLSAAEQEADPDHAVEATLSLLPDLPPLTTDAKVSIVSDTLLSDKFVLVQGAGHGQPLAPSDFLCGTSPTSFDKLVRNADEAIESLGGEASGKAGDLLARAGRLAGEMEVILSEIRPLLKDVGTVVAEAGGAVKEAREVAADARSLVDDNREGVSRLVLRLNAAAASLDNLAGRGEKLLLKNESAITSSLAGLRVTADNLKVTSTYSRFLLKDLSEHPSRLIWGGGKPPALPSQQAILQSNQPIPDR